MQPAIVYTDPTALADLKRAAQADPAAAAPQVARQAEALFLGELLKTLRSSSLGPGLLDGPQADMYRDLLHRQLAVQLSEHGGIGFADAIAGAVGGQAPASRPASGPPGLPRGLAGLPALGRPAGADASAAAGFDSPSAFVTALWPHAQRVGQALGIDGRVILAQAALETGWGERLPRTADGQPSHNLFGIKAHGWGGAVARAPTLEFRDGTLQRESAEFRAYGSYAEAFDDYARFLTENPRYRQALAAGDAAAFAHGLQAAGYATDPAYARKILDVLGSPLLADLGGASDAGGLA
ncbi:flagellar assembly peptidoglycan hydrolase FlgJ [Immundisolibacter sp.]|uniref:flagellar assembly peptidoglycan hydrolase FlgJ n=1 Tax=Immundisolibacter sp. TaxID=1934948 RepID=UPI00262A1796|nr:flagellar assembly peptidoglycan hydrolase FlgJ [Immundisolibacter sp.]MDD3651022.1 flagellar assembly peptidoglycan hydrolase FlgJ [Immundisolibacter sp.]